MSLNVLLVAATEIETTLIREAFSLNQVAPYLWTGKILNNHIKLLHTGIGMTNTALHLGHFLGMQKVDISINVGIAGSYREDWHLAQVVEIVEDTYAELGAEDGDQFLDLKELGFPLMDVQHKKYYNTLQNPLPPSFPKVIPPATGITVNQVHGKEASISLMRKRWNKDIETMEGAAFFQSMLFFHIPFRAFRGISNYMRKRDKSKWRLKESANEVQKLVISMFEDSIAESFF